MLKSTELLVVVPEGSYDNLHDWVQALQNNITIAIRSWRGFNPACSMDSARMTYRAIWPGGAGRDTGPCFGVTVWYHEAEEKTPNDVAQDPDADLMVKTADVLRSLLQGLEQKIAARTTPAP